MSGKRKILMQADAKQTIEEAHEQYLKDCQARGLSEGTIRSYDNHFRCIKQFLNIHGSLHEYDIDPVLGHGNSSRIKNIELLLAQAQSQFDEKLTSICHVISEYYDRTYKHTDRCSHKLFPLAEKTFDEIVVAGHSLSGVDLPYFELIDELTAHSLVWRIYYFDPSKKEEMANNLVSCGVPPERTIWVPSSEFYTL